MDVCKEVLIYLFIDWNNRISIKEINTRVKLARQETDKKKSLVLWSKSTFAKAAGAEVTVEQTNEKWYKAHFEVRTYKTPHGQNHFWCCNLQKDTPLWYDVYL